LNRVKGHWEALIIELGNPNYAKVGAKMTDLEGNELDVPSATSKGLGYKYFGDMKFLPIIKYLFNNPPRDEK
jgi:pre-mRNA-splicing factor ISY1